MACMEHYCGDCGNMVFNNHGGPSTCPKCGGRMSHHWDEEPGRDEPDRPDEPDEEI